jgi:hypothetical protein
MAREITAGVLLKLKDQFSSQIKGAGISVQGFADKAVGVAEKVNKAFSGVAGTLATLGVSIGALGAIKGVIDTDHRMARLGLTADLSAGEVNKLKRTIFEVARMPDIKLDTGSIISGLEVILEKTGDIGQTGRENIENLARAIQAAGAEGSAMGDVFSEFAKNKFSAQEITQLMDDIIAISDMGEYTFVNFANTAKSVLSSYSLIGNTPQDVKNAVIAMQVLTAGTKSAEVAATALDSTMRELADSKKRKALENLGISVRNNVTGEMRDFNDIMADIAAAYEDFRKADYLNTIFGSETQKAIRAYGSEFARNIPQMKDLGDTAGTLAGKSAAMADTLKSNFRNLQTAFDSFVSGGLEEPLQDLANLLNKLAEDPEKIEDAIRNITITLGALAAIRVDAGIVSFVAGLNSLKSGGGLNMSGLTNAGGGAGIPVHVTNWGGSGGGLPGLPGPSAANPGGLVDQYGRPLSSGPGISPPPPLPATGGRGQQILDAGKNALRSPKTIATGVGAGLISAMYEVPEMLDDLHDIDRNETLTGTERSEAKGGAIGAASGSIAGAAGGAIAGGVLAAMATSALAGTAIGTAIPGFGNIAGLIIGAGIGAAGYYFGGKAGRAAGTAIGGAVSGSKELDAAQRGYGKALEEAADTIGKTGEEIETARRKLADAEVRLEQAREAHEAEKAAEEAKKRVMF